MWTENSSTARAVSGVLVSYAVPVTATVSLLLICHAVSFFGGLFPLILLFPVVAWAAWYGGIGPFIVAVSVSIVGLRFWFLAPIHSFAFPGLTQIVPVAAFLLASFAVFAMGEVRRRQNDKLRKEQIDLEARVRQRTAELDAANRSLRELSARLLQLQDDERRRIARELHDSVGQLLVGLSMNISGVRSEIERLTRAAAALSDSEALVQEMTKEVRTISHLLHPPLLDEAGLVSAVRWYVDGFSQRSNIKVDLDIPDDFGRLSRELETAIFRIVQECLTNIHRHSGSLVAKIRFRHSGGEVVVEVGDKGKGIPPEKQDAMASAGTPGVGVRGMRERLRQLGGELEVSSDQNGTVVMARLPVPNASSTDLDTSTAAA